MPNKRTKEPTNKDIIEELRKSRKDTIRALCITVVLAGIGFIANGIPFTHQFALYYGLLIFIVGVVFFVIVQYLS